eukprot:scaffold426912_cov45-Prasinocladus_malaysianus.AAC.1
MTLPAGQSAPVACDARRADPLVRRSGRSWQSEGRGQTARPLPTGPDKPREIRSDNLAWLCWASQDAFLY